MELQFLVFIEEFILFMSKANFFLLLRKIFFKGHFEIYTKKATAFNDLA